MIFIVAIPQATIISGCENATLRLILPLPTNASAVMALTANLTTRRNHERTV